MRLKILGNVYFTDGRSQGGNTDTGAIQLFPQRLRFFCCIIGHALSVSAAEFYPEDTQLFKQCNLLIYRGIYLISKAADG